MKNYINDRFSSSNLGNNGCGLNLLPATSLKSLKKSMR